MRLSLWLLFLCLSAVSPLQSVEKPELRALLPDDFWESDPSLRIQMGGSAVGGAGTPSAFYLAARDALTKSGAPEKAWLELSFHPNLCVRVVGLAALAESGSPAAIPRLRELLTSREGETGMTVGCLSSKLFESLIAFQFLTNTEFLCLRRQTPLLPQKEALALALEVLYRDECAGARELQFHLENIPAPAALVARALAAGRLRLRMDALSAAAPALQPHQLVKAAGRLQPQLATPFLLEILHDPNASTDSRLAAASALARQQSRAQAFVERDALFAGKDALDGLGAGLWGTALTKLSHSDWHWHYPRWPVAAENAPTCGRLVPDDSIPAWSAWALEPERPGNKEPFVTSWEKVPAFLGQYTGVYAHWSADWNAFGDTLYRLELRLRHVEEYGGREIEDDKVRDAVLQAVLKAEQARPDKK